MATLVATFTDAGDAARAAAALQARGFTGAAAGTSDAGPSSLLGLGETVQSFKSRITLGSTIGGAATGAGALGFLGFISMGFTEIRGMAQVSQVPGLIAWALAWAAAGLVLGLIAGLLTGILVANLLANAAVRTAAEGGGVSRPLVVVPVQDQASEEAAAELLKSAGVYELARWDGPAAPAGGRR
jgi:hypothetical protein